MGSSGDGPRVQLRFCLYSSLFCHMESLTLWAVHDTWLIPPHWSSLLVLCLSSSLVVPQKCLWKVLSGHLWGNCFQYIVLKVCLWLQDRVCQRHVYLSAQINKDGKAFICVFRGKYIGVVFICVFHHSVYNSFCYSHNVIGCASSEHLVTSPNHILALCHLHCMLWKYLIVFV